MKPLICCIKFLTCFLCAIFPILNISEDTSSDKFYVFKYVIRTDRQLLAGQIYDYCLEHPNLMFCKGFSITYI